MDWNSTIKGFSAYLRMERGLSGNSVEAYIRDTEKLATYIRQDHASLAPEKVTLTHLEGFVKYLDQEGMDERSQARVRSGVRAFYKYLLVEDLCDQDPTELLEGPRLMKKFPDVLSLDEINALLNLIDLSTDSGVRNRAMLETLYACGLRVSELVTLRISMLYTDLGFVNNFSEINEELIDEVKQAVETGNSTEALHLAENIRQNLEKINFHGKRADGIVKSMLQHSRSSEQSGKLKKEPTDINTLADEYLRLAYHGLRAKDQTFNATLKTDFDPNIGLIQVIPQDIARALLNLITNAFYAVHEKGKKMQLKGEFFSPTVSLSTKKIKELVEIRVQDNGPGIPQNVLDKIFQPFFTTKPTGQGTGLGLSLAYDIVKAHGGEVKVESTEGLGTEFIVSLPI